MEPIGAQPKGKWKVWNDRRVDFDLKDEWLEKLNSIPGVEGDYSCYGHNLEIEPGDGEHSLFAIVFERGPMLEDDMNLLSAYRLVIGDMTDSDVSFILSSRENSDAQGVRVWMKIESWRRTQDMTKDQIDRWWDKSLSVVSKLFEDKVRVFTYED